MRCCGRQSHSDGSTATFLTVQFDGARVSRNDPMAGGQTQPRALADCACREEGVEYAGQVSRGYAAASIGDPDNHPSAIDGRAHPYRACATLERLNCVDQQVDKDLTQLRGMTHHWGHLAIASFNRGAVLECVPGQRESCFQSLFNVNC